MSVFAKSVRRFSIAPVAFLLAVCFAPPLFTTAHEFISDLNGGGSVDYGGASADPDGPRSLADEFDFGVIGLPLGTPGSLAMSPALQSALDAAVRDSEASARLTGDRPVRLLKFERGTSWHE